MIKNEQKRGRFSHFIFDMSDKKLNIFLTAGPNLMGLPPFSLFFQGLQLPHMLIAFIYIRRYGIGVRLVCTLDCAGV